MGIKHDKNNAQVKPDALRRKFLTGVAVALAESCIAQQTARETPRLIGAQVDLSAVKDIRLDTLLFGETQNRVVITVSPQDAGRVLKQCQILGVPAQRLGTVGGETLSIRSGTAALEAPVAELHDIWWNAIARSTSTSPM